MNFCNICGGAIFQGQTYIGDFNGRVCPGHDAQLGGTTQSAVFNDILERLRRIENIVAGFRPVENDDK